MSIIDEKIDVYFHITKSFCLIFFIQWKFQYRCKHVGKSDRWENPLSDIIFRNIPDLNILGAMHVVSIQIL